MILFLSRNSITNYEEEISKLNVDIDLFISCLLYTSDAADERSSVDLGGRRIIKKKKTIESHQGAYINIKK